MPPEFLTRYAGVFLDVHIFPPKRHSNFRSVGIVYKGKPTLTSARHRFFLGAARLSTKDTTHFKRFSGPLAVAKALDPARKIGQFSKTGLTSAQRHGAVYLPWQPPSHFWVLHQIHSHPAGLNPWRPACHLEVPHRQIAAHLHHVGLPPWKHPRYFRVRMRLTWLNLVILPSSSHTNSEIRRMLSAASMTTCLSLRSSAQANGSAEPCCWTASRLNFLLGAKVSDASAGSGFPWGLLFDNLRFQPRRVCLLDTSHRRHTLPLDQQNTFSVLEVDVRTPRVRLLCQCLAFQLHHRQSIWPCCWQECLLVSHPCACSMKCLGTELISLCAATACLVMPPTVQQSLRWTPAQVHHVDWEAAIGWIQNVSMLQDSDNVGMVQLNFSSGNEIFRAGIFSMCFFVPGSPHLPKTIQNLLRPAERLTANSASSRLADPVQEPSPSNPLPVKTCLVLDLEPRTMEGASSANAWSIPGHQAPATQSHWCTGSCSRTTPSFLGVPGVSSGCLATSHLRKSPAKCRGTPSNAHATGPSDLRSASGVRRWVVSLAWGCSGHSPENEVATPLL